MKEFDKIEKRFGIKLPRLYRELAEQKRLDYHSKHFFEMPDCLWLTPKELAKFEWDDFRKPIDGLVPFATNGGGDYFAWYLPEPGLDGEPAVMLCAHDSYVGDWFAPNMAGTVFRQTIEHLAMIAPYSEDWDEEKQVIDEILVVLKDHAPKPWCDALSAVKDLEPVPDEDGENVLMSEEQLDKIITDAFGEKYTNQEFIWDKDGLEDD